MLTIHNYPLLGHDVKILIPEQAELLHIGMRQNYPGPGEQLTAWFLVDTDLPSEERRFYVAGTGWELDPDYIRKAKYITTVHGCCGYVWHVFEG